MDGRWQDIDRHSKPAVYFREHDQFSPKEHQRKLSCSTKTSSAVYAGMLGLLS